MGFNRVAKFFLGASISIYLALALGLTTAWTQRIDHALNWIMGEEPLYLSGEEIAELAADFGAWCFAESFNDGCDWVEKLRPADGAALSTAIYLAAPQFGFDKPATIKIVVATSALTLEGDTLCPVAGQPTLAVYDSDKPRTRNDIADARAATSGEAEDFQFGFRKTRETGMCYRISGYQLPFLSNEYYLHPEQDGAEYGSPLKFNASALDTELTLAAR